MVRPKVRRYFDGGLKLKHRPSGEHDEQHRHLMLKSVSRTDLAFCEKNEENDGRLITILGLDWTVG